MESDGCNYKVLVGEDINTEKESYRGTARKIGGGLGGNKELERGSGRGAKMWMGRMRKRRWRGKKSIARGWKEEKGEKEVKE